jgi:hypothetical protein
MNKRIAQKITETIGLLEADGRTVHRVVIDGKKVEFILTAQDDNAPPKIVWD